MNISGTTLPFSIRIIDVLSLDYNEINFPQLYKTKKFIEKTFLIKPTRVVLQDMTSISSLIDIAYLLQNNPHNVYPSCLVDILLDNFLNTNLSYDLLQEINEKMYEPNLAKMPCHQVFIPIGPITSNIMGPFDNFLPSYYVEQLPIHTYFNISTIPLLQGSLNTYNPIVHTNNYLQKSTNTIDTNDMKNDVICFGKNDSKSSFIKEGVDENAICFDGAIEDNCFNECLICNAPPPSCQTKRLLVCPFHQKITDNAHILLRNHRMEFERNRENLAFIKWCSKNFSNTRIIAPGTGVGHSSNLEHLSRFVIKDMRQDLGNECPRKNVLDVVVGTDSHISSLNGLGILAWGVSGIDALSVMLGKPIRFPFSSPDHPLKIFGIRLIGEPDFYATSTDIVLYIIKILRSSVSLLRDEIVEFTGPGLSYVPIPDRMTIANMSPEYGSSFGFFPFDQMTLDFLIYTGRPKDEITEIQDFMKKHMLFKSFDDPEPDFYHVIEIDLSAVKTWISGPKNPQQRVIFQNGKCSIIENFTKLNLMDMPDTMIPNPKFFQDGDIILAAVTSCSNSTNPRAMLMAGLLAKKAVERGLKLAAFAPLNVDPSGTSNVVYGGCALLSPGGPLSTLYLQESLTLPYLQKLGFEITGYGCRDCLTSLNSNSYQQLIRCILNNSLKKDTDSTLSTQSNAKLPFTPPVLCAILSGNRNFQARYSPHPRHTYLASPALVVAYSLAGTMNFDFESTPLPNKTSNSFSVYLRDIWPTRQEIAQAENKLVLPSIYEILQKSLVKGSNEDWVELPIWESRTPNWNPYSTYIREPSPELLESLWKTGNGCSFLIGARILAIFGDNVTCDHISPAGSIPRNTSTARYLTDLGLSPREFNSFGSRRGNWEVMSRGTFTNQRLINFIMKSSTDGQLLPNRPKSKMPLNNTRHYSSGSVKSIYEVAKAYEMENIPSIIVAGRALGSGSMREWAVKGPRYLGIRAFIAIDFEPVFRAHLLSFGIMPLKFSDSQDASTLHLSGDEILSFNFIDLEHISTKTINGNSHKSTNVYAFSPLQKINIQVTRPTNLSGCKISEFFVTLCAHTQLECDYLSYGGILPYTLYTHSLKA